ncbi:MAG: sulfotransferase [Bacteroidota bacterium]
MLAAPFTTVFDRLFTGFGSNKHPEPAPGDPAPPAVLIVSNGRSGSTIVYQVLVRFINCAYISNLHALFPRLASSLLARGSGGKGPRELTKNFYGYTPAWRGVNEGNRWFQRLFKGQPTPEELRKRYLHMARSLGASSHRPLIMKNILSFDRIELLHRAIPELVFIKLERDVIQHAQSQLKAYQDLGAFSPSPHSIDFPPSQDPAGFAILQVLELNETIEQSLSSVATKNVVRWNYEAFCAHFPTMIKALVENQLQLTEAAFQADIPAYTLKASNKRKVSETEYNRIQEVLQEQGLASATSTEPVL